jgi:hypothetical protein
MKTKEWYEAKTYYKTVEQRTIEKKILPAFYNEVCAHRKTFEIRKDEDNIQPGDIIDLREWDGEKYTGHHTKRIVTYVLRYAEQYGLMDGYCIIAIQPIGWDYMRPSTCIQNGNNNLQITNCGTLNL